VVSEPDILEVVAVTEEGFVQLTMEGANLYNVELNGLVTQTMDSNIQLELKEGQNTLKVYTDLPCQGVFEQTYFNALQPILSPNPTAGITEVYLNGFVGAVSVKVFSSNGRLVKTYVKKLYGENLELNVSELSKGAYYLQVEAEGIKDTFKLIKK
jgi:hypothetical protein